MPFSNVEIATGPANPALKLEVTNLSNTKPADGEAVTADVRITNTAAEAFTIPWSGDRSAVPFAPGAKVMWVQAEIDLTIRSPRSTLTLASPVNTLYGVKSKPETWKTLAPGESATVRLGFKVHTANAPAVYPVTAGNWDLTATWSQAERILFSNECKYESGWWFDTVKNEPVPLPIEITLGPNGKVLLGPQPANPAVVSMHVTLASGTDGIEFDNVISAALRRLQGSVTLALGANSKASGELELQFAVMKDGSLVPGSVNVVNSTLSGDARDAIVQGIGRLENIAPIPVEFDRKSIEMRVAYAVGSGVLHQAPVASGPKPPETDTGMYAGGTIVSPAYGVDFSPYLRQVVKAVREKWVQGMPQAVFLGAKGVVSTSFTIEKDGSIGPDSVHIDSDTSGRNFGDACVEAIRKAAPFSPLPEAFPKGSISLRFGFYFNEKAPGSSSKHN
jgi:hypothetical protein